MIGDNGSFLISKDLGLTWKNKPWGGEDSLRSIYFLNDSIGWIGGMNISLYQTRDKGKTWTKITPEKIEYPTAHESCSKYIFNSIRFFDEHHGIIAATNKVTKKSRICMHFHLSFNQGVLLETFDGGITWKIMDDSYRDHGDFNHIFLGKSANDMTFLNDRQGWAICDNSYVFFTEDGGETWKKDTLDFNPKLKQLKIINDSVIFAAGRNHSLVKTKISPLTDISENSETHEIPNAIISFSHYPNPFAGQVSFEFQLKKPGKVGLSIFNLLGERVDRPVKGQFPPGKHKIIWKRLDSKGNELPQGVYFYKLNYETKGDGETLSGKMLLLK